MLLNNNLKNLYQLGLLRICLVVLAVLGPCTSATSAILRDCFGAPAIYTRDYQQEIPVSINKVGEIVQPVPSYQVADGPTVTAECQCPPNMSGSTEVRELTAAGSPLSQGHSADYGYLTDNLDVDVTGLTDAINSPSGSGLYGLDIHQYPTPVSAMEAITEDWKIQEKNSSVCNTSTSPVSPPTAQKHTFKWNAFRVRFYIKHPILGEEIIPSTPIVQYYSCLYFGSPECTPGDARLAATVLLSGKLTAPLSCTINAGNTIEVDLGTTNNTTFVSPGVPPNGYTLREVNISYHCDDPAAGNVGKIIMTLTADQGVSDSATGLIAKLIGRDDLGIRIFDEQGSNVVLDGSFDFPINLNQNGDGVIKMKAAPVSTTPARPAAGKYEGNVTVKMDIR